MTFASFQATTDSLNQAYTEIWQGAETAQASGLEQALASNDLIFVVLTVSLIIWAVLLTYIIRLERNVSALERRLQEIAEHPANETGS